MPARAARRPFAHAAAAAEVCEARRLLTTFVVTDSGDATDASDGVLTYREALLAAEANAGADVVTFADGVGGVVLEADLPALTDDLSVVADASGVTLDHAGFAGSRLSGGDFTFSNVTFINAAAGNGAALDASGGATLSVVGGAFADNAATDDGGAVRLDGAAGTFTDTLFYDNAAGRSGGAVYAFGDSDVLLTDATVLRNTAEFFGGAVSAGIGSFGEGLDGSAVTITGGYFALNESPGWVVRSGGELTVAGATFSTNTGGAVAMSGGGSVADSLFFRNAHEGSSGGALFVSDSDVTVTDSTFRGNSARFGGAVAMDGEATLSLVNVRMFANGATSSGGAVHQEGDSDVTVEGGRYAQNRAGFVGGAFTAGQDADSLSLSNLSINRNVAGEDAGEFGIRGGGAVYVASNFLDAPTRLSLDNVFAARNRAVSDGADGGALLLRDALLTVTDSNLAGNTADRQGGNVFLAGLDAVFTDTFLRGGRAEDGGGLAVRRMIEGPDGTTVRFDGGGLIGNEADQRGGGIYLNSGFVDRSDNAVILDGVRVRGNRAAGGGAAFLASGDGFRGQGTTRLTIRGDSLLRNNRAENRGGVFLTEGRVTLDGVTAVGNRADEGAVAFAFEDGEVVVRDAVFRGDGDFLAGPGEVDDRR